MLHRIEDVEAFRIRDPWGVTTGHYKYVVRDGSSTYQSTGRVTREEWDAMEEESRNKPVPYMSVGSRTYWRYQSKWFTESSGLVAEQLHHMFLRSSVG